MNRLLKKTKVTNHMRDNKTNDILMKHFPLSHYRYKMYMHIITLRLQMISQTQI